MSVFTIGMLQEAIEKTSGAKVIRTPKIIESAHVYKISFKVRGYPAAHHPNRNRPYYRAIKTTTYPILYMKLENSFVCHPIMAMKLRERLKVEVAE